MEQPKEVTGAGRPADATVTVTVSLGKGAWDCDKRCPIPPEKEVHPEEQQAAEPEFVMTLRVQPF